MTTTELLERPQTPELQTNEYTTAGEVASDVLRYLSRLPELPAGIVNVPLVETNWPTAGHTVLLKDETRHWVSLPSGETRQTSAFKRRGAWAATYLAIQDNPWLSKLSTASSGNHGLNVAASALEFGLSCDVHTSKNASSVKLNQARALGANVNAEHNDLKAALLAANPTDEPNTAFIHPYDQPETLAGQATIGLEILDDLYTRAGRSELDLHTDPVDIVLPVGGGGLATAVAIAVKQAKDNGLLGENIRVITVQAADKANNEWCDGTRTTTGKMAELVLGDPDYVQVNLVVSDLEIAQAMHRVAEVKGLHKKIEPAGALASAGALQLLYSLADGSRHTIVAPVTGANVTDESYQHARDLLREQQRQAIAFGVSQHLGKVASKSRQSGGLDIF